jgi:hypothetical protein
VAGLGKGDRDDGEQAELMNTLLLATKRLGELQSEAESGWLSHTRTGRVLRTADARYRPEEVASDEKRIGLVLYTGTRNLLAYNHPCLASQRKALPTVHLGGAFLLFGSICRPHARRRLHSNLPHTLIASHI